MHACVYYVFDHLPMHMCDGVAPSLLSGYKPCYYVYYTCSAYVSKSSGIFLKQFSFFIINLAHCTH